MDCNRDSGAAKNVSKGGICGDCLLCAAPARTWGNKRGVYYDVMLLISAFGLGKPLIWTAPDCQCQQILLPAHLDHWDPNLSSDFDGEFLLSSL